MFKMVYWDEPKRVPIPSPVKREVYKRANGRCECLLCLNKNFKMTPNMGVYHHLRTPKITPTAKTVLFLCPNCHQWHAHKRKTKTEQGWYDDTKVSVLQRMNVSKHDYSDSKKVIEVLTITQLKELAKLHKVSVKGKKEDSWNGPITKQPTKTQYITAISKKVSPQELTSSIKKLPQPEKKKKKRRSIY